MPVPPISFPPFGNPPFLIPPPNSNPPKGGKPQGALARRPLWRGWGNRGAPLPPRSRAPPPFGFPDPLRRLSPLRLGPRGAGRVGRAGEGSFLTPPQPFMEFASSPFEKSGSSLSPRCAFSPPRGRARRFCGGARPRAEERLQNNDGEIPIPPWRRACCPAAGNRSGQRGHPFHRNYFWQPATAHYAAGQLNSLASLEAACRGRLDETA